MEEKKNFDAAEFIENLTPQGSAEKKIGPSLFIAGPGTGKTYTMTKIYSSLISSGVASESILVSTFSNKAADELIRRINKELTDTNKDTLNMDRTYIGTFHSLCLKIIKEYGDESKKKLVVINSAKQQAYVRELLDDDKFFNIVNNVFPEITLFKQQKINSLNKRQKIKNPCKTNFNKQQKIKNLIKWQKTKKLCEYFNKLSDSGIDLKPENIADTRIKSLVELYQMYLKKLDDEKKMDFSLIQREALKLLQNPEVIGLIREKIRYILIDEYQDTNLIQEKIICLLAGDEKNICVVGDDDQAIYRFRGATVKNILDFPKNYGIDENDKKRRINLEINHRSSQNIIDFYSGWIEKVQGRYPKEISAENPDDKTKTVFKLIGENEEKWQEKVLNFIKCLKDKGIVSDYNQIAFLFHSVRDDRVRKLSEYLEGDGITVYSPRSGMLFGRDEIMELIGCLIMLFPDYCERLKKTDFKFLNDYDTQCYDYYNDCIKKAKEAIGESPSLKDLIEKYSEKHGNLERETSYSFTGLIYRLLGCSPFKDYIPESVENKDYKTLRPAMSIAQFIGLVSDYEKEFSIDKLHPDWFKKNTEYLFNKHLREIRNECRSESEIEAEYAPKGSLSFLTIHQSKGMEFPVVIVGSLERKPDEKAELIDEWLLGQSNEQNIPESDYRRLYYTAFSRAKNLLVLTAPDSGEINDLFKEHLENLTEITNIEEEDWNGIKSSEAVESCLTKSFSFTNDFLKFEKCPRQYMFERELNFPSVRPSNPQDFGKDVHSGLAEINERIREGKEKSQWLFELKSRYSEDIYPLLEKYAKSFPFEGYTIRGAEKVLSCNRKSSAGIDYQIKGKVDLILENNDGLVIVDNKTGKMDIDNPNYQKQLRFYAYMANKCMDKKVSQMKLYYVEENRTVDNDYVEKDVNDTMEEFDAMVDRIRRKDYSIDKDPSKSYCETCSFRWYCGKEKEGSLNPPASPKDPA